MGIRFSSRWFFCALWGSILLASGAYDHGTATGKGKLELDFTWNPFNLFDQGQSYVVFGYGLTDRLDIHGYYATPVEGGDNYYIGVFYQFFGSFSNPAPRPRSDVIASPPPAGVGRGDLLPNVVPFSESFPAPRLPSPVSGPSSNSTAHSINDVIARERSDRGDLRQYLHLATAIGIRRYTGSERWHIFFPQLLYNIKLGKGFTVGGSAVTLQRGGKDFETLGTTFDVALFMPLTRFVPKAEWLEEVKLGVGAFRPVLWRPKGGDWYPTYSIDMKFDWSKSKKTKSFDF